MNQDKNTRASKATENEDGLPDIAENMNRRSLTLIIVVITLVIIGLIFYGYKQSTKHDSGGFVEENFTVFDNAKPQEVTPVKRPSTSKATANRNPLKNQTLTPDQLAFIQAKQKELHDRLNAPLMLVNNMSDLTKNSREVHAMAGDDVNTRFMNQVSAQTTDTISATSLGSLRYLLTQGNFIHADLETAINSDLPGYIRAEVREPVYSDDGSQLLIAPGSKLIGEYRSGILQGQSRIFVVWTRLIMGNTSINLNSPGVDNLGVAGFGADSVNYHFFQRFGTAALLSLMGAGVSNIGVNSGEEYNAAQAYRMAVAESFSQSARQTLSLSLNIPPTLYKNQGAHIMVFVAHDLNFKDVLK